jgi:glycosyltransferase involved in cell wall biosynthesis
MRSRRLLILVPFPQEAAYTRYRALQFVPDLEAAGIETTVIPFLNSADYAVYYGPGRAAAKAARLTLAVTRRIRDAAKATAWDAVLIGREAMLFGPAWIESLIARGLRRPLIYDFDDAIYLPNPNTLWGRWSGLASRVKCPEKTDAILLASRAVLAGNAYLAEHARRFNRNVTVIPTVVDPDHYPDVTRRPAPSTLTVGWVGTHTTAPYLERIAPALAQVAQRRSFQLHVVGAGTGFQLPGVAFEARKWSLKREHAEFGELDIGLYPLPDSPWTRGKCGFKAIQYLAAGVPVICSPVGVNREIVEHERSGLYAETDAEWAGALERLLDDAAERRRMGMHGRLAVRERWSRQAHSDRFVRAVEEGMWLRERPGEASPSRAEGVAR